MGYLIEKKEIEKQENYGEIINHNIQPIIDDIVAHQKAENAPVIEFEQKPEISIDDFAKIQMKGFLSEGMIVCAEDNIGNVSLLSPEKDLIADGSDIS